MAGRRLSLGLLLMAISHPGAAGVYLSQLTWPEAAEALPRKTVILPFAAGAKEHGPHLPLGTDALVMEHLVAAAVAERDVVAVPPVLHGWFPAFRGYPGTEVSDPTVFQSYVRAVAESLVRHGAENLVILNLGITRATGLPLSIVARDLAAEHGVRVLVLSWDDLEDEDSVRLLEQERGGHADEGETSIVLHLAPELAHMDRAVTDYREPPVAQLGYVPGVFDRRTEVGSYGDPTLANAEKGAALLEIMTRNLLKALDQFAG
jgi:creatinine amidohydrolase